MIGNIYKKNFDPDAVALKYKNHSITYYELDQKVQKYATYLSKIGVKKGDKVILSCINSPEFIYSYLAAVKLGAIIVPINLLLTFDEISYIIKNSDAKTMIVHPSVLEKLKETKKLTIKTAISMLNSKFTASIIKKILGINIIILNQNFNNTIDSLTEYNFEEVNNEDLVSTFLYTSGTTGKPKAAMLSHYNLLSNVTQVSKTIDVYKEDNFMCVLPMFHAFGFTTCVLVPLYHGATITILPSFQPKELVDTLVKEEVTLFPAVPSMYIVLLEAIKSNITFPKLRLAVSGGASIPGEIFKRAKDKLNFPLIEGYGLSEASPVVTLNPLDKQKMGSIGKPLYGVECKIVDEEGNELPPGEVGELAVKGDNIMLGYYKQQEASKRALKNGWLYTEDMATKDEDGYYYIVDRKKDLIIVGGLNVYPREVEEALYQHPKVKETAVIGVMDNLRGEYIKAYVVLKEKKECHSRELLRHLKQRLAQYKLPRKIEFVEDLPKNSMGKILKKKLRDNKEDN